MHSIEKTILVVEDSDEDFTITEWALKKALPSLSIVHCKDGEKAIQYIETQMVAKTLPAFVLLDLNLPRTNGHQVTRHIKGSEQLKSLPVIIFTSSENPDDVSACYRNGANSYLVKPVGLEKSLEIMHGVTEYWLRLSLLPDMTDH